MNLSAAESPLAGANVFLSGATGSFGNAFARHALSAGAARIVCFSRDEAKQAAMRGSLPDERLRFYCGDVRDRERVEWAMRGCDVVIHAAAMKRIDAAERDPSEAIATNVTGSQNVALAAIRCGVARAVMLSTDKAASPCTLYGSTKAVAERAWIQANGYAAGTPTKLAAVRYGNILGSTGSVVPMWRREFEQTGCLTLTDPNATRFWMVMAQAVALVNLALAGMRGGETFVARPGAASVGDLARAIAPDAIRRVIGLQGGEKMHETLISADEASRTLSAGTHFVVTPAVNAWGATFAGRGEPVARDFALSSDTADALNVELLRAMLVAA